MEFSGLYCLLCVYVVYVFNLLWTLRKNSHLKIAYAGGNEELDNKKLNKNKAIPKRKQIQECKKSKCCGTLSLNVISINTKLKKKMSFAIKLY